MSELEGVTEVVIHTGLPKVELGMADNLGVAWVGMWTDANGSFTIQLPPGFYSTWNPETGDEHLSKYLVTRMSASSST